MRRPGSLLKFCTWASGGTRALHPAQCSLQVEEKAKFDGIFESLLPVNGLLSGDKVKPVLMNSKLPLDVLGRVSANPTCKPGWALKGSTDPSPSLGST